MIWPRRWWAGCPRSSWQGCRCPEDLRIELANRYFHFFCCFLSKIGKLKRRNLLLGSLQHNTQNVYNCFHRAVLWRREHTGSSRRVQIRSLAPHIKGNSKDIRGRRPSPASTSTSASTCQRARDVPTQERFDFKVKLLLPPLQRKKTFPRSLLQTSKAFPPPDEGIS